MKISTLQGIVDDFQFSKGNYAGAERQLSAFAECYSHLSPSQAQSLREMYSAKERLGWFKVGVSLVNKLFDDAPAQQKQDLLKIFFAFYSFENLDFGYDALMDVIDVSSKIKERNIGAENLWYIYRKLTKSQVAIRNLESKCFPYHN